MELKKAELGELREERYKRSDVLLGMLKTFSELDCNCVEVIGWREYYTSYETVVTSFNRLSREHFGGEIKAHTRLKGEGTRNERGHVFLTKNV